jgi:hypothetical protein
MKGLIILCILAFFIACGNKKQTLADEEEPEKSSQYEQADSAVFTKGIKFKESRAINKANPPATLDYTKPGETGKELDISQYYSTVKYIKLKHPQKEEGKNQFFTPTVMMVSGEGIMNISSFSTKIIVTDNYILAGDPFYGLHCYDLSGNYLHTLTTTENPPMFKKTGFEVDISDMVNVLAGFQVTNDICMFTTLTKGKTTVTLYDLKKQDSYYSKRTQVRNGLLFDREVFADYSYNPTSSEREAFIHTFNINGDTLCSFLNHNMLPQDLGATVHSIAYMNTLYYYNNQLTIRQSGNDTVYRFAAPNKLEPAYILNWGKYKSDIQDLLKGNTADKKVPDEWVETDKLIFFTYSEGKQKRISVFDKSKKEIFYISKINNTLQDGIPFDAGRIQSRGKGLYCIYTKDRLKNMMSENPQNEKIKSLYNDLQENELLIMISTT